MVLGMEFFPGFMSGFGGVDSSSVCMGGEPASSHYFSWRCMGLAPVVATAFSTYKSPKFYLSFTILVSFILVKYPDRIGLVIRYSSYVGTGTYLRYGRQADRHGDTASFQGIEYTSRARK